jgi:O-antigen/teichoic acid export membrane protein/GT2 family glycosyltransferase
MPSSEGAAMGMTDSGLAGNASQLTHSTTLAEAAAPRPNGDAGGLPESRPVLSICIPTYNQVQYLPVSIHSALSQEYDSFEIVVSDNQSTDGTAEYLNTLSDDRIRIVRPDRHMNKGEHFDFCVSRSLGKYVTVLCSDDVLFPSYARKLTMALEQHPTAAFGYSAASIFDEDRQVHYAERHVTGSFYRKGADELRRFLKNAGCVFPTMMMRREMYDLSGGFCLGRGAARDEMESVIDWDLQLRLLGLGDVVYHDEVLAEFRVWETPERKRRILQCIEETGRLYETRIAEIVSSHPALRANAEKARRARALSLALGLSKLNDAADLEEGSRLILKVSESVAVRSVLRLYAFGFSGVFAAYLVWDDSLRRLAKKAVLRIKSANGTAPKEPTPEPAISTSSNASSGEPGTVAVGGVRRVTKGVLANMLGQAINGVGQVVLIPIFLACWGKNLYGEWLTLSAAVTYLAMLDFGMQMFVVNRLNQCYVRGDYEEHARSLHSALLLSLTVAGAVLLLATPVFLLIPLETWFHFTHTTHSRVVVIELLLCAQVIGALPCGLISGCYRSMREYPREQMVFNVRTTLSLALTALVVTLGGGLATVAGTQLGVLLVATAWVWRDLRVRHPEVRLGLAGADLKLARSFLGPSSLFFLIQVATMLAVQGSVVMIGALFGAASVAVFVPLRTLANAIRQLSAGLQAALWPEVTALETANQYQTLRSVHLIFSKLVVVVSVCSAIFLHLAGPTIIASWTHHNIFDPKLFDAFLGLLVCQSPWMTGALVLAASNNHRRFAVLYLISSITGLSLGYYLAHRFGMPGVVYGLWIPDVVLNGWLVSWTACRLMRESFTRFAEEVLLRGAVIAGGLYLIMGWMFSQLSAGRAMFGVSAFGLLSFLLAAILAYVIYFNKAEKGQIRSAFTEMALRRRTLESA